jgi:hypothetical protein
MEVHFIRQPLYDQVKDTRYTSNTGQGGPRCRYGSLGEKKKLDASVVQPVSTLQTNRRRNELKLLLAHS